MPFIKKTKALPLTGPKAVLTSSGGQTICQTALAEARGLAEMRAKVCKNVGGHISSCGYLKGELERGGSGWFLLPMLFACGENLCL